TPEPAVTIDTYSIDATVSDDLRFSVITKAQLQVGRRSTSVLTFSISDAMRVSCASVDGVPAGVFQSQSLHSKILREDPTSECFLVAPAELRPGSVHEIRIEHEGDVLRHMSNSELLVGSRQAWYPRVSALPANYELSFNAPAGFTVIASGKQVTEYLDGTSRITKWKSERPIRFATFNIGQFSRLNTKDKDFSAAVYFPDNLSADSFVAERITE